MVILREISCNLIVYQSSKWVLLQGACRTRKHTHSKSHSTHIRSHIANESCRRVLFVYRVAKSHKMPYLCKSFSAKEPCKKWLFCGKWPTSYGILRFFATLYIDLQCFFAILNTGLMWHLYIRICFDVYVVPELQLRLTVGLFSYMGFFFA